MGIVEFKGKMYELGKCYKLIDTDGEYVIDQLKEIRKDSDEPFKCADGFGWKDCQEINPESLGTIKVKPKSLIPNDLYKFVHTKTGEELLGIYSAPHDAFLVGASIIGVEHTTDVIHLVPEKD